MKTIKKSSLLLSVLCSLFILFIAVSCAGESSDSGNESHTNGSICGTVTLDGTKSGNTGILVFVAGTSYMAMTDDSGNYKISDVPAGSGYQVVATKNGVIHYLSSNVTVPANGSAIMANNNFTSEELEAGPKDADGTDKIDDSNNTYKVKEVKSKGKIGDVLLNDGTVVSYTENIDFTDEQKKKAVCILAYFNDNGEPVGLGLHNSSSGANRGYYMWANPDTKGYSTKFTDIICTPSQSGSGAASVATFTGDLDGSDNWACIYCIDPVGTAKAAENYPAFNYVNKYAETFGLTGTYAIGWYMPSIAELSYIYRHKTIIDSVLKALNGTLMASGTYWSSSHYYYENVNVLVLDFSDGNIYYYYKFGYHDCVCCVRAFK